MTVRDATHIETFRKLYPHLKVQKGLIIAPSESRIHIARDMGILNDLPLHCAATSSK